MKILVVDDDEATRYLLGKILAAHGEVDVATDGVEAVSAFSKALMENAPYDVALMDIMMPRMDGQETVRRLRELEAAAGVPASRECKVIMVTALGDVKNVFKAYYKGGAYTYLTKPIDANVLLQTLRDLGLKP